MKNKQEFTKKMNIATESFMAIENFYGKMKTSPHLKDKFINSIKKEINKITRIKEVSGHRTLVYPNLKVDLRIRI